MQMLGENPVENIVRRMFSRRSYIVEDYVHQIVWRESILGEYAERYAAFVRELREATPGLDDGPVRDYSWMRGLDCARYHTMDFSASADMVHDDAELRFAEYVLKANIRGLDVYTEEEFAFVKSAFTEAFKYYRR